MSIKKYYCFYPTAPNVQSISVTQSSLSTFNVNFALNNPAKQDCVQTYVVEDQESAICNATNSSTFVECSGPNLCTRDGYTLVGYASDRVSEGERSNPFTFIPDHSRECVYACAFICKRILSRSCLTVNSNLERKCLQAVN